MKKIQTTIVIGGDIPDTGSTFYPDGPPQPGEWVKLEEFPTDLQPTIDKLQALMIPRPLDDETKKRMLDNILQG